MLPKCDTTKAAKNLVIGLVEYLLLLFSKNNIAIKSFLKMHCYTIYQNITELSSEPSDEFSIL